MKYGHIFLDVGNIITHDWAPEMFYNFFVYNFLDDVGKENFFETRITEIKKGNLDWLVDYCKKHSICDPYSVISNAWNKVIDSWCDINVIVDESYEAIKKLSAKYDLSIAANQPKCTIDLLKKYGLYDNFKFVILDDLIGTKKPDKEFFLKLLKITKCDVNNILYVGDRIENDILPSKAVGMNTMWVQYEPTFISVDKIPKWWQNEFIKSYKIVGNYNMFKFLNHDYYNKTEGFNNLYEISCLLCN